MTATSVPPSTTSTLPTGAAVADAIRSGAIAGADLQSIKQAVAVWVDRFTAGSSGNGREEPPITFDGGEAMRATPVDPIAARKADLLFRKYGSLGVDAVDRAAQFSRDWSELRDHGKTSLSEARYVQINMNRTFGGDS